MSIRRPTLIFAAIAIVLVCLVIVIAIPPLLHVDRYRPRLISYLQGATGKEFEIGHLALNLIPLAIHIDHIGVRNPPIFPKGYIIQVARVDAQLSLSALLHRRIAITSLVLEDPILNVTSDPDGPWNFESAHPQTSANPIALDPIPFVQIRRGVVVASNLLPSDAAGPIFFEAHDISADLRNVNLAGIINPASSSMDGQGTLKAAILRFGAVEVRDLDSQLRLESRQVFLSGIKAELYSGNAVGTFSFDLSAKNASFQTSVRVQGINLAQLLAAFPNGEGRMTGKMEGEVKLAGDIAHSLRPLAGIHGAGHLTVRNGKVPSLKLNANLMKLAHFNDLGPAQKDPSSFNMIATDLELADQKLSSRVIDIDGYGVDVDGSGSVSMSGSEALNYRGLAEITTKESFFTNTIARLSGAKLKDGKLQFPFRITGTIDSPVFAKGKGDQDTDAQPKRR